MTTIYERNINSTVKTLGPDTILTEAGLLDLSHNMRVALQINIKTRKIEKATAIIVRAPLRLCDTTVDTISTLEGLKIEKGINKELVRLLSGADGCTHLYELALNAIRLSFNVLIGMQFNWNEWVDKSLDDEAFIKIAMPHLKNTCRPFKKK